MLALRYCKKGASTTASEDRERLTFLHIGLLATELR
jgi:hypothetical protein